MLVVGTYFELLAVNRALMEVRFLGSGVDDAVRGSPPLADVHSRLIDELIAYHHGRGEAEKVASWERWRVFGARAIEIQSILEYLSPLWPSLDSEDLKRQVLETQMRPFVYESDDVDRLYRELERGLR